MQDWLLARAEISPQKAAINGLTYAEMAQRAQAMAAYLSSKGVGRGDHLAALLANNPTYAIFIHALRLLGAVVVPLNLRLTTDEISWQVQSAHCKYLLRDESTETVAAGIDLGDCRLLSVDQDTEASAGLHRLADADIDLDAPCAIIHSSGTSGRPKGVVLTYDNFFYSAMASAYRLGHQPDDIWLCVLPLYHVGGLSIILRSVLYGITVDLHEHFDLDVINWALDTKSITLISLVPTMLHRLLDSRSSWPESLRLILLGGAAASPELLARCREIGLPVATTYGLTEAASQVATMLPGDVYRKPGSVGKPLLFTNLRVVDQDGEAIAPGKYGEIIVSGPTIMQGYYNDTEATTKALHDGELHTGDIGYVDDEGDLFVVQRRTDLIVSGGENVYPAEVERVLRQHSAVQEAAVVGIPDDEWGQIVAAAIVLKPETKLTTDELVSFCRTKLAGYKTPRRALFVDQLPQTASGKIHRGAVVNLFQDAS